MSTASQDLFNTASAAIWDLLNRCRADASGVLVGLGPEPRVAGTALEGRLLAAIGPDTIVSNDPAASTLLKALAELLPPIGAGDLPVALHGFDPGGGLARGLALLFVPPAPSAMLVVALTADGPAGIAIEIDGVGAGAVGPAMLTLRAGWSVEIGGDAGGGGRLQWPRGGAAQVAGAATAARMTLTLRRAPGGGDILIGPAGGPSLRVSEVVVAVTAGVDTSGAPAATIKLLAPMAQLDLAADIVAALVGEALSLPIDLNIDADPRSGLSLAGGGVRATVPANISLPGIDLRAVELSIAGAASGLEFGFGVGFTAADRRSPR